MTEQEILPNPIQATLIDLWTDPATRNYTAPLARAAAEAPDIQLSLLLNRAADNTLFQSVLERCPAFCFRAPTAYLPLWPVIIQPWEAARLAWRIRSLAPDLAHITFMHPWLTAMLPWLHRRIPLAITWHDLQVHSGEEFRRKIWARAALMRHADLLFVHSENHMRSAVIDHSIDPDRLVLIPHGTYEHWRPLRSDTVEQEPATFLFFGRILHYKGLDILLQAFQEIADEHPAARLIIAGAGDLAPYRSLMQPLAERLEIHNRHLTDPEAVRLFQRATVVVLSHREVTQSGILFSAAAMEKPVIATRVGALIDEIQHQENGLLVPPDSAVDLAEAMRWILSNPQAGPPMGQALRSQVLRRNGPEVVMKALQEGYRRALKNHARWLRRR